MTGGSEMKYPRGRAKIKGIFISRKLMTAFL